MSRKSCGVNGVYYGLKSSIFIEVDDLWITGRSLQIRIFKKIFVQNNFDCSVVDNLRITIWKV